MNIQEYNKANKETDKEIDFNDSSIDQNHFKGMTSFNIWLNRDEDLENIILNNSNYTTYKISSIHMYGIDVYGTNTSGYIQLEANDMTDEITEAFGGLSLNQEGSISDNKINAGLDMKILNTELLKILKNDYSSTKRLKEIAIVLDLEGENINKKEIVIKIHLN